MENRPSSLAGFGITQWPTGTQAEIEEQGLDARTAASCSKPGPGVKGCPRWAECRFNNPGMGGFKGQGPQYIGFRIINPADGTASQDVKLCWDYVHTLQPSADAGAALRRVTNGKQGSIIRVIAQEGDEIVTQYDLPVNGKGEVVNVMPEMVEILEANKVKFSTMPGEVAVTRRFLELKRMVPIYARPSSRKATNFAQRVALWDLDNENRDRDYEQAAVIPEEENLPLSASPVATPVKRGPGRPRKEDAQG